MTDPTFGLGHPGGLIVTGGLGHAEPAAAGVMAAHITGSATVAATLSADGASGITVDLAATITGTATITATLSDGQAATVGSIARLGGWRPPAPTGTTVDLAATIVGTSTLTATAAATLTADDMTLLSLDPDLFLALAA